MRHAHSSPSAGRFSDIFLFRRSAIIILSYRKSNGISYKITKRTGPHQLPESLIHEGPGRFAAPSAVALATNTCCTSAHITFPPQYPRFAGADPVIIVFYSIGNPEEFPIE